MKIGPEQKADIVRRIQVKNPDGTWAEKYGALYSNDAICVGALWCGDRTLPSVMPIKNIAASIKAITPS